MRYQEDRFVLTQIHLGLKYWEISFPFFPFNELAVEQDVERFPENKSWFVTFNDESILSDDGYPTLEDAKQAAQDWVSQQLNGGER